MTVPLRHQKRPCNECPWRVDAELSVFPPERYEALACTSGTPGAEAPVGAPMFACHKTAEGREVACAGWLAVAGAEHLGVRLAVASGRISPGALARGDDWPELYASFEEMAAFNGFRGAAQ
ncbi:DUF6283 family protein [Nocardia sp. CDC159]|uniref:DUF6283 family protein n=1 Tax=Nocardia pulmonis TaxID=2951408 RepID=A0A9X2J2C8_9NOCA|nr:MULTISPECIES: DUF6283 family protein [Nocardia]MCM6777896.1 DUF6283 family protein [Nocardia pulmonis]MCM6790933.1 DUF6283 family protein [Nocardia sp. CDC159]